jgi:serine/threonine protein kinase
MKFLHSIKILHRDLKADNVYLDEQFRPRIGHFGFAKQTDSLKQSRRLGTPVCVAPEVFQSVKYSFPPDVYSFAMIVYEILEGRPAKFKYESKQDLKRKVCSGIRPQIKVMIDPIKSFVEQMWHKNESERPSFSEIVQTLEDQNSWPSGVVAEQFFEYKRYLDIRVSDLRGNNIISESWLKQSSLWQQMEQIVDLETCPSYDILIRKILGFLLNELGSEALIELDRLLEDSFNRFECVNPNLFIDFAQKYLVFDSRELKINVCPLTTALICYSSIRFPEVDSNEEVFVGEFGESRNVLKVSVKRFFLTQSNHCETEVNNSIFEIFEEIMNKVSGSHPSIVRFVGWTYRKMTEHEGEFYIVNEWMDHGYLKIGKSLSPTDKMKILYGCSRGIARLHEMNIFHGDIRPENILLDSMNCPRIDNFGLSKSNICNDLKRLIYRSPEDFSDSQSDRKLSDVYSFGILCFVILCDKLWEIEDISTKEEFVERLGNGFRPDIEQLARNVVSEELKTLLIQMWNGNPNERPIFSEISAKFEDQRFWLKGTNEIVFRGYIETIIRKELYLETVSSEWNEYLSKIESVVMFFEHIEGLELTKKVIEGMRFICSSTEMGNEIARRVTISLEQVGSIDPNIVNDRTHEELI